MSLLDRKITTKIRRTIYMTGWDACLIGKRHNPYTREDYKRWWKDGFDDCMANKSLPWWFNGWSKTNAAKRLRLAK